MGNTTQTVTDYAAKAQEAATKTAQATTKAVTDVASLTNKTIVNTASSISTMASSAVQASVQGTAKVVNKSLETDVVLENKIIVDVSQLHDCQMSLCKTEMTQGNGTVYNTLEYVLPMRENINHILEQQVNPVVEENIKFLFTNISQQINVYNQQKDSSLISKIRKKAQDTYGFDARRHASIVNAVRDILSKLLDFNNVECKFSNEWFEFTLIRENDLNTILKRLKPIMAAQQFDFSKIEDWHDSHYFPIDFNGSQIYVNINVGFKFKYIKVEIYKKRLFSVMEQEIEYVVKNNWNAWIKHIKKENKSMEGIDFVLRFCNISIQVNPQSRSKVNFDNRLGVRVSKK